MCISSAAHTANPMALTRGGRRSVHQKLQVTFTLRRVPLISYVIDVANASNSTTSSKITFKKNSSNTSKSESKEELRARDITVQPLQMLLKVLVERCLKNQFSGKRKPTKNPIQQKRRKDCHPNKTKVVAIHPKSRNSHL